MRLILLLALLALAAAGCGRKGESRDSSGDRLDELRERTEFYKSVAPRGWDVSSECDALLFVSLQQVGLGEAGPVEQAQSEPGHWHRLPAPEFAAACSSDISRDMFTGLFVWIWEYKRLDLAEQIWEYGSEHSWKMGEERKDGENRVRFSPATIGLLAELIFRLGGEDHLQRSFLTVTPLNTSEGFQSHLTLLQLYLRGEMHGSLTAGELDDVRQILTHMSQNPLAHALLHKYTDGDQSQATELLLNIWPADRLPTARDWSEEWRTQRSDSDSGLQPGETDEPHSGGDLLFVARIILGPTGSSR